MAFKLASLFVEIGAQDSALRRTLAGVKASLASLAATRFSIPGGGFAAMLGLGGAGLGISKIISGASDLSETLSKVGQVYGDQAKKVIDSAQQMADAFGIPKREFLDAASAFGLIAIGMGQSKAQASDMSIKFAKLAADAASFYNVPVAVALEKIRAGLTGESEPLKAFGVIMDEDSMKAQALAMGLVKKGQELSNSAKLAARAALIEKGLAAATGDLARTADGASNQVRKFWGQLENLGDTIGTTVLPSFTKLISLLNEVATDSQTAANGGSGAWSGFVEMFSSSIETAGDIYRNFGDIIERTGVMIGGWIMNIWEAIAYGNGVVGAVASYFKDSFIEAFELTMVAAGNLKDNFVALLKELWEAFKSGGTHIIDVKFRPLLEGAQFKGDGKFVMPELKLSSVDNQIAAIDKRMQDRADERANKQFDAAQKAKQGNQPGTPAAAGAAAAGTSSKTGVTDADSFARELQEGALKDEGIQKDILSEAKAQSLKLDIIARNTSGQGAKQLSTFF